MTQFVEPIGLTPAVSMATIRPVLHEAAYFMAMMLLSLAALKIATSYLLHRDSTSGLGNGLAWFLSPA